MDPVTTTTTKDEIKNLCKEYITVCDALQEHNKSAKDLRAKKKNVEEIIQNYMLDNDIGEVNLHDKGKLKITKNTTQKKLSKSEIFDTLLGMVSEDQSEKIIEELFDADSEKENVKLEYKKPKSA